MADTKKSFKDTLNLPHTDFPIRSNPKVEDPEMVKRWEKEELFTKSFYAHEGQEKYILHDGPPYANGHIHLGTAYNKILKDIVGKSQRMLNQQVPITPGWDCHGLPIEFKVTQENPHAKGLDLIKKCRDYARKWIDIQREEFKSLGVLMDWKRPYLTMNYSYESLELQALGMLVEKQYVERQNKTVPWCPSCKTVLATAEIEYAERKDPSIYVSFELTNDAKKLIAPELKDTPINVVIWTTTPWTLPLNRAVLAHPTAEYVLIKGQGESYYLIGQERAQALCDALELECTIVKTISGESLDRMMLNHPFISGRTVPIILDEHVGLEEGTAFVHCAPGAGPEDYEIGVKNKLEIFSPVDDAGKYTAAIEPSELEGMPTSDGQIWVLKKLKEVDALVHKTSLRHSYPHCWRCRGPLMFRATKQWFIDLSKHNLKDDALAALPSIQTIPENAVNRLYATIESRWEWCISRQRTWGTPIPALICEACDHTYTSQEFIDRVAVGVAQEGIEYWRTVNIDTLLPENIACDKCGKTEFKKELDILDVWFDAGVSHYAVLKANPELAYPANLYSEGKDQHRGWFQSSLLTSMAIEGTPCMKAILTHGYTVDEKGRKMSKSIGNVVQPAEIIEKIGTDGLRLWVSSIDTSSDAVVSETLLKNVQEVFRKIRNTARFLLSNIYDFDIEKDAVSLDDLEPIDTYALYTLFFVQDEIIQSYKEYDPTAVFHALSNYCASELSSFYLDIVKDRLYVEAADERKRRSAQTVCYYILDSLTRLMAPILSFTAERISDHYQKDKTESIHLQLFAPLDAIWQNIVQHKIDQIPHIELGSGLDTHKAFEEARMKAQYDQQWKILKDMRSAILKAIEELREKNIIKHSLEAQIDLYMNEQAEWYEQLKEFITNLESTEKLEEFFKEFCIVSQCTVHDKPLTDGKTALEGFQVNVSQAQGTKCPRCWQWDTYEHPDDLCRRCAEIVS